MGEEAVFETAVSESNVLETTVSKDSKTKKARSERIRLPGFRLKDPTFSALACFLATLAVVLVGAIVLEVWPKGDRTMLIVDSIHQYLPFYSVMQRKLVSGENLFYSFSGGFGFNFWTTIAYYLASPLNLLMRFVPNENVCDFMDYAILFKLALCGATFAWTQSKRRGGRLFPIAFGLAYGCSAFMIGYAYNLMWIECLMVLPLVLYGIERLVKGGSGLLYAISLFFGIWCNYYLGFMLCLFSVLYLVAIEVSTPERTARERIVDLAKFALLSLLAGGMASVLLIPAWMGLKQSQAVVENSFPSEVRFFSSLTEMLESHMAVVEPMNIADTQKGQNVYCGVFAIPFVLAYFLNGKKSKRERISMFALCGILLLSFSLNSLNYVWHGFHVQNGLPNRFSFIYVALILMLAFDGMKGLKEIGPFRTAVAFAVPTIFVGWRLIANGADASLVSYGATIALLGAYAAISSLDLVGMRRTHAVVLSIAMVAEIGASAVWGMTMNGSVARQFYLDDAKSYRTTISQFGADGEYRSEIDRQHMRNAAMFAGAQSVVMFNSTMAQSVTDFCEKIGVEARTNKNGYYGWTKLMNDMFGVKYVASPARKANSFYGMRKLTGYGPLDLYENENALPLAYVVDERLSEWNGDDYESPFEAQNAIVELATGKPALYEIDDVGRASNGEVVSILLPEGRQSYLYLPWAVSSVEVSTPEYDRTVRTYNDFIWPLNPVGDDRSATFSPTLADEDGTATYEVWSCDQGDYEEVVASLAENGADVALAEGNVFEGSVNSKKDGILLLTIPYDEGWTFEVDGKEVETERILGTFTGIRITEGIHSFSGKFVPKGFGAGLAASLASLAGLVAYAVLWRRRRKRNGLPEKSEETTEEENPEDDEVNADAVEETGEESTEDDDPTETSTEERSESENGNEAETPTNVEDSPNESASETTPTAEKPESDERNEAPSPDAYESDASEIEASHIVSETQEQEKKEEPKCSTQSQTRSS